LIVRGLTNFKGSRPTKAETETAKNHLTQAEKDYLEIMGEDIKKLK
jgi:hypothetical protein